MATGHAPLTIGSGLAAGPEAPPLDNTMRYAYTCCT